MERGKCQEAGFSVGLFLGPVVRSQLFRIAFSLGNHRGGSVSSSHENGERHMTYLEVRFSGESGVGAGSGGLVRLVVICGLGARWKCWRWSVEDLGSDADN